MASSKDIETKDVVERGRVLIKKDIERKMLWREGRFSQKMEAVRTEQKSIPKERMLPNANELGPTH